MSSILVTGGAGFIGTALIKKLYNEGHRVVSLDDYSIGSEDNHITGVKYIKADIELVSDGVSFEESEIKSECNKKWQNSFYIACLGRLHKVKGKCYEVIV